jgi:hypothetical protein
MMVLPALLPGQAFINIADNWNILRNANTYEG